MFDMLDMQCIVPRSHEQTEALYETEVKIKYVIDL